MSLSVLTGDANVTCDDPRGFVRVTHFTARMLHFRRNMVQY